MMECSGTVAACVDTHWHDTLAAPVAVSVKRKWRVFCVEPPTPHSCERATEDSCCSLLATLVPLLFLGSQQAISPACPPYVPALS